MVKVSLTQGCFGVKEEKKLGFAIIYAMQQVDQYSRRRALAIMVGMAATPFVAAGCEGPPAPVAVSLKDLRMNPEPYNNVLVQTEGYVISSLPTGTVSGDAVKRPIPLTSIIQETQQQAPGEATMQIRLHLTEAQEDKRLTPYVPTNLYRRVAIRGVVSKTKSTKDPIYTLEALEITEITNP